MFYFIVMKSDAQIGALGAIMVRSGYWIPLTHALGSYTMPIETPFLIGIVAVSILIGLGLVLNLEQGWRKNENAINSPMSITLKTEKTPADLLLEARLARGKRHLLYLLLAAALWLFFRIRFPEETTSFESAVMVLLSSILRGLAGVLTFFAEALA